MNISVPYEFKKCAIWFGGSQLKSSYLKVSRLDRSRRLVSRRSPNIPFSYGTLHNESDSDQLEKVKWAVSVDPWTREREGERVLFYASNARVWAYGGHL